MFYSMPLEYKITFLIFSILFLALMYIFIRFDEYKNFKKVFVNGSKLRIVESFLSIRNPFTEKVKYIYPKQVCVVFERAVNFSDMDNVDIEVFSLIKLRKGEKNILKALEHFNKVNPDTIGKIISSFFFSKPLNEFFRNESLIYVFYENRETLEKELTDKINTVLDEIGFKVEKLTFDFKDDYIETLVYKMIRASKNAPKREELV